jgi:hypothetical protein
MKYVLYICLFIILFSSKVVRAENVGQISEAQSLAVDLMRTYCQSCHALGNVRFITSEDNGMVWRYILSEQVRPSVTWAQAIIAALDWSTLDPDSLVDPRETGKSWMPIGSKRYTIVERMIGDQDAREYILEHLRSSQTDQ